jgi:hypothetical protein
MAVDGTGHALTYAARKWSAPARIDPAGALTAVSCPSQRFCTAADSTGHVLTYHSGQWSAPITIDRDALSSVSCPSPAFCAAVDRAGKAVIRGRLSPEPAAA